MSKLQKMYEVGEQVMIKVKIIGMSFDDHGRIKYRLKDEKSNSILRWEYTDDDIVECSRRTNNKQVRKKTNATKKKETKEQ